ncbi:hypothetical protein [Acinetobacter sp.]|uniref:hypothetical protein n=1 Tax=Acinetobacter sp. TaxID=472 RepID=UPI00388FA29D
MNITIEQLRECVEASRRTIKVHTPSTDYYARSGDHDTDELTYMGPERFLEAVNNIVAANE